MSVQVLISTLTVGIFEIFVRHLAITNGSKGLVKSGTIRMKDKHLIPLNGFILNIWVKSCQAKEIGFRQLDCPRATAGAPHELHGHVWPDAGDEPPQGHGGQIPGVRLGLLTVRRLSDSSRMSPEAELYPEWQDGGPLWRGETGRRHVRYQFIKMSRDSTQVFLVLLTVSWPTSLCQRVSKRVSKLRVRKASGPQAHVKCSNVITISCLNSMGEMVFDQI